MPALCAVGGCESCIGLLSLHIKQLVLNEQVINIIIYFLLEKLTFFYLEQAT